MFDLPDAKRIRRSDIYARSQSSSPVPSEPDPELEAQFRACLASIYGVPSNPNLPQGSVAVAEPLDANGDVEVAEEESEHEFEFRLFSSTAPNQSSNEEKGATQKIILVDEEEHLGDGGFVVRERNRGYYFAEKADGERWHHFEVAAMSGEDVLSRARRRAWGLEVPWRVRVVKVPGRKASGVPSDVMVSTEDDAQDPKKKRPGKKRRIVLRERKRAREKLQEQKRAEKDKKEEAEREKRTRRNREKKVKRKLKEKAKKEMGNMEHGGEGVSVPEGSSVVDADEKVSD